MVVAGGTELQEARVGTLTVNVIIFITSIFYGGDDDLQRGVRAAVPQRGEGDHPLHPAARHLRRRQRGAAPSAGRRGSVDSH